MSGPVLVAPAELAELLRSNVPPVVLDATLLLARPQFDGDHRASSGEARWRAAHIPGARHVDLATRFHDADSRWHFTRPSAESIAAELAALGVGADRAVVVYDSVGTLWAARLWYLLRSIGHDVRVLDGGLGAWSGAGLPLESGDVDAPPAVPAWRPRVVIDAWAELDEVRDGGATLVCGLADGAFRGTEPTRYARRGRIPGSVNVVARELVGSAGRLVPPEAVVDAFAARGVHVDAPTGASRVILYCGGGISAALAALALATAGVEDVRIYDGSLEEWSADPALPLEVDEAAQP